MSFPLFNRQSVKTYLTENGTCKLSVVCYSDGIMDITGQMNDVFATGSVDYWTSLNNPIIPNKISTTSNNNPAIILEPEPYFNIGMNKGVSLIINGQFKFSVKYTLRGDFFKLPSSPIYIHMIIKVDEKPPIDMDIKMDLSPPIRIIDDNSPQYNTIQSSFYDGYKDHEYYEKRQQFRNSNKPNYGDRCLTHIDLPNNNNNIGCHNTTMLRKSQEYFGLPKDNFNDVMNAIGHGNNFKRKKRIDITPFDPLGRF